MRSDQHKRVVGALHAYWSALPEIQTIAQASLDQLGEMPRKDKLGHCVVLAEDGVWLPPRLGGAACRITVQVGGVIVSGLPDKFRAERDVLCALSENVLDQAVPGWRASVAGSSDSTPHSHRKEENARFASVDESVPENIGDGAAEPVACRPEPVCSSRSGSGARAQLGDDPLEIPAFLRRQPRIAAASQRPAATMRPGPPSDDDLAEGDRVPGLAEIDCEGNGTIAGSGQEEQQASGGRASFPDLASKVRAVLDGPAAAQRGAAALVDGGQLPRDDDIVGVAGSFAFTALQELMGDPTKMDKVAHDRAARRVDKEVGAPDFAADLIASLCAALPDAERWQRGARWSEKDGERQIVWTARIDEEGRLDVTGGGTLRADFTKALGVRAQLSQGAAPRVEFLRLARRYGHGVDPRVCDSLFEMVAGSEVQDDDARRQRLLVPALSENQRRLLSRLADCIAEEGPKAVLDDEEVLVALVVAKRTAPDWFKDLRDLFKKHGLAKAQFNEIVDSFAVSQPVQRQPRKKDRRPSMRRPKRMRVDHYLELVDLIAEKPAPCKLATLPPMPILFRRGQQVVHLDLDSGKSPGGRRGKLCLKTAVPGALSEIVEEAVRLFEVRKVQGVMQEIDAPLNTAEAYKLVNGAYTAALPEILGIADGWLFDKPHGQPAIVHRSPGWQPTAGVILERCPAGALKAEIDLAEAEAAFKELRALHVTMPYEGRATLEAQPGYAPLTDLAKPPCLMEARGHAGIMIAIMRPSLDAAPNVFVSAPAGRSGPGAGKGTYTRTALVLGCGGDVTSVTPPLKDETGTVRMDELDKRIDEGLMRGGPALKIDNLNGVNFTNPTLESLATDGAARIRILGKSESVQVHGRTFIIINGNGLTAAGDMIRRALQIRLDTGRDNMQSQLAYPFKPDEKARAERDQFYVLYATLIVWGLNGCPGTTEEMRARLGRIDRGGHDKPLLQRAVADPLLSLTGHDVLAPDLEAMAASPRYAEDDAFMTDWVEAFGEGEEHMVTLRDVQAAAQRAREHYVLEREAHRAEAWAAGRDGQTPARIAAVAPDTPENRQTAQMMLDLMTPTEREWALAPAQIRAKAEAAWRVWQVLDPDGKGVKAARNALQGRVRSLGGAWVLRWKAGSGHGKSGDTGHYWAEQRQEPAPAQSEAEEWMY
jgi:hypothetical protein